jgi:toluene monooxygenase system protein B
VSEPDLTPSPVPVNALFGTDFVTLLVVVLTTDTMAEVSSKVAAHVVGKRVAPRDAAMGVFYRDELVPQHKTVAEAGITPMQFVFVDYLDEANGQGTDDR